MADAGGVPRIFYRADEAAMVGQLVIGGSRSKKNCSTVLDTKNKKAVAISPFLLTPTRACHPLAVRNSQALIVPSVTILRIASILFSTAILLPALFCCINSAILSVSDAFTSGCCQLKL